MHENNEIQNKVIGIFQQNGYNRRQIIQQDEVYEIFNKRSLNTFLINFDIQLFKELMQECKKNIVISPQNIATVIQQALDQLSQKIQYGKNNIIKEYSHTLYQKQQQLQSLSISQHKGELNQNRSKILKQSIQKLKQQIKQVQHDLKYFERDHEVLHKIFINYKEQTQFEKIQKNTPNINHLEIIFFMNTCASLLEVFITIIRPSFFTILYLLHVYYLLFVGYYNMKAGMFLLLQNMLSVVMDIGLFVCHYLFKYINVYEDERYINFSHIIIIILQILLIISIIIRLFELYYLYQFKEPPLGHLITFKILKWEFKIRKRIKIKRFLN